MSAFGLSQKKEKELLDGMRALGIFEKDLQEGFVRSSGPGGQNINKVATCVHLLHVPTGILVKCQKARTQGLNRYYARLILVNQIKSKEEKERQKRLQEKAKLRRQMEDNHL